MKSIPKLLMVIALLLVACGGGIAVTTTSVDAPTTTTELEAPTTTEAEPTTTVGAETSTTEAMVGAELVVATTDLGDFLTDAEGRTLYIFTPDAQGDPTCSGDCAANWPALTAEASAGAGVDESLLGTAPGVDGATQVTYNGWPLYYFAGDPAAGDVNGQGVGGVWFVIGPDGEPIQ